MSNDSGSSASGGTFPLHHGAHNSHGVPPTVNPVALARGRDQPFLDPVAYGNGPDDAVTDTTEGQAITHHTIAIDGRRIAYTATVGHLVTVDSGNSANAKVFYVAFTQDGQRAEARPVTFFYDGGPGSSSVFALLGSFAPRRIRTSAPAFTPAVPYQMEDNPDSLLDKSDLVFVSPVGTGYSAAVAPYRNRDFWGVDEDADSLKQFIQRYLTKHNRWHSPKYLFGESYGAARSCVLAYKLHEDGIDLNGITLQSSMLDYRQAGNPVGVLPTAAASAWYHKRLGVTPTPTDLGAFAEEVAQFARTDYLDALRKFPQTDNTIVQTLSDYTGIDTATLQSWSLDIASHDARGNALFLAALLRARGLVIGSYDGRVTATSTDLAGNIDPNAGGDDPAATSVSGAYLTMWNTYLSEQLKYTANSAFTDGNDQVFSNWNFAHVDPAGKQVGVDVKGDVVLDTAGDLAAVMALNADLKVLLANGLYDFVTPFYQAVLDLQQMPLDDANVRKNLSARFYPSGHRVYLDGGSRTALKRDLAAMYDRTVADAGALTRIRALQAKKRGR